MALIGCFVTPHPPIIVPEVGGAQLIEAQATVNAMREAGERTAALAPDTIVLLSPHAPSASHQMGVSLASSYKGSLAFFRAPDVRIESAGDPALGEAIMAQAEKRGIPAVVTASPAEVVDLDWGAMVPLVYLMSGLPEPCRLVLLSFSQLSLGEHTRFGEAVGWTLLAASQRVLYVASGDLSHRLIPGAPAGFDPRGVQFDRTIVEFFGTGEWDRLMSIHPGLAAAAGECGYRSLAVLSGVVAAATSAGATTKNRVLSYEGPFGVGYLVGEVEVTETSHERGTAE
jgi:aromatic ring-opening dioxygenase LigB subunit